jgi:hypothetical protein
VPRVTAFACAGILEWLELQAMLWQADCASVCQKQFAINRNKMGHRPTQPYVPMKPESAVHRMRHAFAPARELSPLRRRGSIHTAIIGSR